MLKKELIGLLICTLLITVAVAPGINALTTNRHKVDEVNVIRQRVDSDAQSQASASGSYVDNLALSCHGIYPSLIPLAILRFPVSYVNNKIVNNNDIAVYIHRHIKLTTPDERILYEFDENLPWRLKSGWNIEYPYFPPEAWKFREYTFGFFDVTIDFHVPDDNSTKTLVFHGFNFYFGAIIFNRNGEIIE